MAAVAVVVLVTAVNNYQKEQQFRALNQINDDVKVGTTVSEIQCSVENNECLDQVATAGSRLIPGCRLSAGSGCQKRPGVQHQHLRPVGGRRTSC